MHYKFDLEFVLIRIFEGIKPLYVWNNEYDNFDVT